MIDPDVRKAARAQLRKDVKLMRDLGVARWKREEEEIFLGPPPAPEVKPRTVEEEIALRERAEEQRHETLFAATSTRPVLPTQERTRRASVLKSVVQRPPAQEHDDGKQESA